ncbi:hypothetical protein K9L67_05935 [Candidatus Woesearchaeota archaeon]|nr:hypothetical protein [Candidatus Woesearchaeota archaeon]MCF7901734.1 hypothetical protein [Candidatus Woesearchaeota archaeon]MCF8013633.1 hypothetical protein [Candidatus Woesearchaeota archaeon]
MEDDMELGGNIRLSGFNVLQKPEVVVVKKIVGSYARKFSDNLQGYESLDLHLKEIHKTESSEKFELHAKLINQGKIITTEVTERNIFIAVDSALKKIEQQAF